MRRPWSEENYFTEFKELLYFKTENLTYGLGKNVDFLRLIVSILSENKFSDKLKALVLRVLDMVCTSDSIVNFEILAEDDYLYKTVKQAFAEKNSLLLPVLGVCRNKYKEKRFKKLILEMLEKTSGEEDEEIRQACVNFFTYVAQRFQRNNEDVHNYIKKQYSTQGDNTSLKLTKKEIIQIAAYNPFGDDTYALLAEMFNKEEDYELKKCIISAIIGKVDSDIEKPSLQRAYLKITKEVLSWSDETIVGRWLLYIFYVQSETLLDDLDDIFDLLKNANDDVFQVFVKNYGYFCVNYNNDVIDNAWFLDELEKLIRERQHPRERKLIKEVEDIKMMLGI